MLHLIRRHERRERLRRVSAYAAPLQAAFSALCGDAQAKTRKAEFAVV